MNPLFPDEDACFHSAALSDNCAPTVVLFFGSDDVREFWTDVDHYWQLLRKHGERWWAAYYLGRFQFASEFVEELTQTFDGTLSTAYCWQYVYGSYQIVPTAQS